MYRVLVRCETNIVIVKNKRDCVRFLSLAFFRFLFSGVFRLFHVCVCSGAALLCSRFLCVFRSLLKINCMDVWRFIVIVVVAFTGLCIVNHQNNNETKKDSCCTIVFVRARMFKNEFCVFYYIIIKVRWIVDTRMNRILQIVKSQW